MSHRFLTRRVSQLLGLALVFWAFARIGVHRPSLRLTYLVHVFSIRSYLSLDFNRVSSYGLLNIRMFKNSYAPSLSKVTHHVKSRLLSPSETTYGEKRNQSLASLRP